MAGASRTGTSATAARTSTASPSRSSTSKLKQLCIIGLVRFGLKQVPHRPATPGQKPAICCARSSKADRRGRRRFQFGRQAGRKVRSRRRRHVAGLGIRRLVRYNDGFRTGLIGTPADRRADRRLQERGVNLLLLGFLHPRRRRVLPAPGSCRWSVSSKPISPPAVKLESNSPATASRQLPIASHRKFHSDDPQRSPPINRPDSPTRCAAPTW